MLYCQANMGAFVSSFLTPTPTETTEQQCTPKPYISRHPPVTIHSLPPELLHILSAYLPTSSLISLKLSTKPLYNTIPLPTPLNIPLLPRCERTAIRNYLSSPLHARQRRRRCLGCNTLQPTRAFRSETTPICTFEDPLLTALIPPACLPGTLRRRMEVLSARMKRGEAVWVEIDRVWCAHDRHVVGWHVPDCHCRCESCAHVAVGCFVRCARKVEVPKRWGVTEDGRGIEEEGWLRDGDEKVERKRIVPIMSLDEAEKGVNVLELSHASLLTLL